MYLCLSYSSSCFVLSLIIADSDLRDQIITENKLWKMSMAMCSAETTFKALFPKANLQN